MMGVSPSPSEQKAPYMVAKLPAVSVIVPCRNEKDHIEACLHSILSQELPDGGFEVIVADGMSDDETRDLLKRMAIVDSRLRVIDNPGCIISMGLNAAIRVAKARVIIRMDAHTRYAPDYIHECLAALQESGADNVGGPWIAEGRGIIGKAVAAAFQCSFAVGGARGHDPSYEGFLDTVYLGCWPREVFDRIGLFDEKLIRSEDDELNLRLTRAGGRIWQSPRIKSWYQPRDSFRALFRQCMHDGYWKVAVIRKHKIPASLRHLVPGGFVLSLILIPLLSPWWAGAWWAWLALIGAYLTCNIAASFLTALRTNWKLLPLFPAVFACYHFGYGYGFLRGIWDFTVLRHGPGHSFSKLTRMTAK